MPKRSNTYNEKLFKSLQSLCKIAIDKVIRHRDVGNLEAITYQYLPVKSIDYTSETFIPDWEKLQYFDFYDWHSSDFVSFFDNELYTLPEFEIAAIEVMQEFKVPEHAVKRIGLFSLLRLIMKKTPNAQINYDNIDQYIQLFIDGYESYRSRVPTTWVVELWLSNIYLESDEIEIAPNVFLKRPSKEKLADIKPKPNRISEFDRMTGRRLIAGAILSFSVKCNRKSPFRLYPEKVIAQIEQWMNVFRLLKPTDTTVVFQSISPISIFEHSNSESKQSPQDKVWQGKVEYHDTSSYKLYINKDEEDSLKNFIKVLKPLLKGLSHKSYLTGNSYELAIHRYNDSLIKSEVNAYRIVASISSFESLYKNAHWEKSRHVKPRLLKLLSFFRFNSKWKPQKLDSAYSLRNALAHGEKPRKGSKNLLKFARLHTHEILNFNRICLLIALQLKQKVSKSQLLNLIDNSFEDVAAHKSLKKLIKENVIIPIVDPFPVRHKKR